LKIHETAACIHVDRIAGGDRHHRDPGGTLLPALSKAKASARTVAYLNNLKQWGLATQIYVTDNNDYLPREGLANPQAASGDLDASKKVWYLHCPRR
jgi:hypothetical protein